MKLAWTWMALLICPWLWAQEPRIQATPPLPERRNPVSFFRDLLLMSPADRDQALFSKTEQDRNTIRKWLAEYESMDPNERELRLQQMELNYFLTPLLQEPPSRREGLLKRVPSHLVSLMEKRLKEWDRLPPPLQAELLGNRTALHYFTRPHAQLVASTVPARITAAGGQPARIEKNITTFQSLPEPRRDQVKRQFQNLFELDPEERSRALRHLSDAERTLMEKTLADFEKLAPSQRLECIQAFEKFARMTPEQRKGILRNASAWEAMTPNERQQWRDLVQKLPPLPPGFDDPPLPPDMIPPGIR